MKDIAARVHGHKFRSDLDGRRSNILELEGDDIDRRRELPYRVQVLIFRTRFNVRDLTGRRVRERRIRVDPIA